MKITISVDDAEVKKALSMAVSALANPKPMFEDIGRTLRDNTRLRFRDEIDPFGVKWKPLAKSTLAKRRKAGKGAKILRDTARLVSSITYRVDSNSVIVGTNVEYAPYHQFGAHISRAGGKRTVRFKVDFESGRSRFATLKSANFEQDVNVRPYSITIPARPFLGVSAEDKRDILEIAADFLRVK